MFGYIDNYNFKELEPMRYYSHPKSYKGDPKEEAKKRIFSEEWLGARKMDGAFAKFIKDEDGNMMLLSKLTTFPIYLTFLIRFLMVLAF